MQRRCTESTCRRVFRIGSAAPVRCPYCGTIYPRVQPDSHALQMHFGYSVRADLTGILRAELPDIRQIFPLYSCWPWYIIGEPAAIGEDLSLREARDICRCFQQHGIPADVITTWDGQRQHLRTFRAHR